MGDRGRGLERGQPAWHWRLSSPVHAQPGLMSTSFTSLPIRAGSFSCPRRRKTTFYTENVPCTSRLSPAPPTHMFPLLAWPGGLGGHRLAMMSQLKLIECETRLLSWAHKHSRMRRRFLAFWPSISVSLSTQQWYLLASVNKWDWGWCMRLGSGVNF